MGQAELRGVQRCMRYCRSLRERKAAAQAAVLRSMGVDAADIRVQKPLAGVLKPCYVIVRDRQLHAVVLAIRGTHSLKVSSQPAENGSRSCRMLAWQVMSVKNSMHQSCSIFQLIAQSTVGVAMRPF